MLSYRTYYHFYFIFMRNTKRRVNLEDADDDKVVDPQSNNFSKRNGGEFNTIRPFDKLSEDAEEDGPAFRPINEESTLPPINGRTKDREIRAKANLADDLNSPGLPPDIEKQNSADPLTKK